LTLEELLGYRFRRPELLEAALGPPGHPQVQCLEFLGDAALGLALAELLVERLGERSRASQLRAVLASQEFLARLARQRGLVEGLGERRATPSVLARSLECLVGAIFLDGGWEEARRLVRAWFTPLPEIPIPDPKGELRRRLGGEPEYRLVRTDGPPHDRRYETEVVWRGAVLGRGRGRRRREAEQQAAREALRQL